MAFAFHQRAKRSLVRREVKLLNLRFLLAVIADRQTVGNGEHPGGKCIFRVVPLELAVRDYECVLQQVLGEMMVFGLLVEKLVQRFFKTPDQALEGLKAASLRVDGQSAVFRPDFLAGWLSHDLALDRLGEGDDLGRDDTPRHRDDISRQVALGRRGLERGRLVDNGCAVVHWPTSLATNSTL